MHTADEHSRSSTEVDSSALLDVSWCSASQRFCSAEPQQRQTPQQHVPSTRFLGRDPPACSCKPSARYVPSNLSRARETVLRSTYMSACLARCNTTVGNLPPSSHTRTAIAEDLLSQGHRVRTRRTPAFDHVRSVKVLFFSLSAVRFFSSAIDPAVWIQ